MGIALIVFILIILLFGFDSTGQVKTRQQRKSATRSIGTAQIDAVIPRGYVSAGNVIEAHEHVGFAARLLTSR